MGNEFCLLHNLLGNKPSMEIVIKVYARPSYPIMTGRDGTTYYDGTVHFVAGPLGGDIDNYYTLRVSGSIHRYCKFFNPKKLLKDTIDLYKSLESTKLYEQDWDSVLPAISIMHDSATDVSRLISYAPLIGEFKVDIELIDYLFGVDFDYCRHYNYDRIFNYFKNILHYV